MATNTLPRIKRRRYDSGAIRAILTHFFGFALRLVFAPVLLLIAKFVSDDKPRSRFDGDNMGGNDGDLTPYDQQTTAERDAAGAWDVDLRGDE